MSTDLREWAEGSLKYAPDERSAPNPEDVLALLDWVDRVKRSGRSVTTKRNTINVRRLARALDNLFDKRWGPYQPKLPAGFTTVGGAYAEDIVAEYDRLCVKETPPKKPAAPPSEKGPVGP